MTPTQEAMAAVARHERPGTALAAPDVEAWARAGGHEGLDAAIVAIEAERGPDGWSLLETLATIVALSGGMMGAILAIGAIAHGRPLTALAWAAVAATGTSWIFVQWGKVEREGSKYARLAELRRIESLRRSMSSSVATIGPDGIEVHSTLGGGIITRRLPPELVRSCDSEAVGPRHATLAVRTLDGSRVEIPWVDSGSTAAAAFTAFSRTVAAA